MKHRYYIASGLQNFEEVRHLKAILDAAGWEHTYDWTVHGSVQREGKSRIAQVASQETMLIRLSPKECVSD